MSESIKYYDPIIWRKNVDTALSYYNLGSVHETGGQLIKAEEYYKLALDINIQLFGEDHVVTANSFANLGSLYSVLNIKDKAIEFMKNALEMMSIYFVIKLGSYMAILEIFTKAEEFLKKT